MLEVTGILTDAGVDDDTIQDIKKILTSNESALHGGKPDPMRTGVLGGSAAGIDLETQTATAHQHVVEALTEMVRGLGIYRANLTSFQRGMDIADSEQQQAFDKVRSDVQGAERYTTKHDFTDQDGDA